MRTMVITVFGPEAHIMPILRMRKKKWWKMAVNAFRSSKFSTLKVGVAESNGVVRIVAKTRKFPFLRMRTKIWRKKTTKLCQIAKISVLIIEIDVVVTTDFRSELEITSRHVASRRVRLTLTLLSRPCGPLSHATPCSESRCGRSQAER